MANIEPKLLTPFTLYLGDLFLFPRDLYSPLRVITNLREPGSIEVNAAAPSLRSETPEHFKFFGSTHPLTDLGEIVDHWNLDRIVRAYESALYANGFEFLGESRVELVRDYSLRLFSGLMLRNITAEELHRAIDQERRLEARFREYDLI